VSRPPQMRSPWKRLGVRLTDSLPPEPADHLQRGKSRRNETFAGGISTENMGARTTKLVVQMETCQVT
jgi:hypothetical protein